MKTISLAIGLAVLSATALVAGNAAAGGREATVTTEGGTYTGSASRSCGGGTCSRQRSVTGPDGNSAGRSASITDNGDGTYSTSRSVNRLNGNSRSRSGTITTGD